MNANSNVASLLLVLALAAPAAWGDDPQGLRGELRIGYRAVDVGGTETKYKEDLNLDDGPRLFGLSFVFEPDSDEMRQYADRVELDISNFGGDPFETFHFGAQKYGRYDFRFNRTKATYFYEDVILPGELATPSLSNVGDLHHFDFDRVRDTAALRLDLSRRTKLNFGFERFTKQGESTTTLDLQRDEFEFDKPIDESFNDWTLGLEHSWSKVTLVVEERYRDYENLVELFLPGRSPGENTTNLAVLDFFFLDQPYDYQSLEHTVRLNARPNDKLLVRASAVVQSLELDVTAEETSGGTGFNGAPFTTDVAGEGEIDRDAELFDVDLTYLITERVALVGGVRRHHLDQDGTFVFGAAPNRGTWDVETTGVEAGVEWSPSAKLTVTGGLRFESRDVELTAVEAGAEHNDEAVKTDHDGFYANLAWRPSKPLRFDLEAERSSYDDPFTVSSPTDRERYRLRAEYKAVNGFYAQGTVLLQRVDNDTVDWLSDRDQYTARLGYRKDRLDAAVGYSSIQLDRAVDQVVNGGTIRYPPIRYEADADFIDGRVRFQATDRLAVGGDVRLYDNAGTFGIARDDLRGYLEVTFLTDYLVHLGYRTIDYDEDDFNYDDYDADIIEVALGYRW